MTATTRWSYSRGSTFIALTVLACFLIFSNRVVQTPSRFLVRRDLNVTAGNGDPLISFSRSSFTPIASQNFSRSLTALSSTQSPSGVISTPSFSTSNTSHSIPTITSSSSSSSTVNPTTSASLSLSTSTSLFVASSVVVTADISTTSSIESSTESSSSPTFLFDPPTQSVTFTLTSSTISTSSSSPSFSPVSAVSSNPNFWKNKPAMISVFVIVALIASGVIGFFIITFFKRRAARRDQLLHDRLFDHYTDTATSRSQSPGHSIYSAPMDAFATRQVGYESPLVFPVTATKSLSPLIIPHNKQPSSHYTPPSHSKTAAKGPPVAFNNRVKRGSTQPSIDSFYCGPSPSSDCKGYAL